jgi:Relaxase/Mobilisation nuclease domain
MIAKHIVDKGNSNKYSAKTRINYITEKSVDKIIENMNNYTCDKSSKVWYINLPNSKDLAISQMQATQEQNTRSKCNKTYHYMISFREGEKPNDATMIDIEKQMSEGLGLKEYQRVVAIHDDTAHYHMHIIVNKIHPITHKINVMSNDQYIMNDMCVKLEHQYNLQVDNHIDFSKEKEYKNYRAIDFEKHTGAESFTTYLINEFKQNALDCNNWQELHNQARKIGVIVKLQGAGLVFKSAKHQNITVKASDIARNLSKGSLEKKMGVFMKFKNEKSDLNTVNQENNTFCMQEQAQDKNNAIMDNIETKFYEKKPLHKNNSELWGKYKKIEEEKAKMQIIELAKAKENYMNKMQENKIISNMQKEHLKSINLTYEDRLKLNNKIYTSDKDARDIAYSNYLNDINSIYKVTKKDNWLEFLMKEAVNSQVAMRILQSTLKKQHIKQLDNSKINNIKPIEFLKVDNKYIGYGKIAKNGEVHYKTIDNGHYKICSNGITIIKDSFIAKKEAFDNAIKLYGNKLSISGDNNFIDDINKHAKDKNIKIYTKGIER